MKKSNLNVFSLALLMSGSLFSASSFAQTPSNCEEGKTTKQIKTVIREIDRSAQITALNDQWFDFTGVIMKRYFGYSKSLSDCQTENQLERAFTNACTDEIKKLDVAQMNKDIDTIQKMLDQYDQLSPDHLHDHFINLHIIQFNLKIFKAETVETIKNQKFNPDSARTLDFLASRVYEEDIYN